MYIEIAKGGGEVTRCAPAVTERDKCAGIRLSRRMKPDEVVLGSPDVENSCREVELEATVAADVVVSLTDPHPSPNPLDRFLKVDTRSQVE